MKRFVLPALAGFLVLFALFVWPTRYRFDHHDGALVRIDRLTGRWEVLGADTWDPAESPEPKLFSDPPAPEAAEPSTIVDGRHAVSEAQAKAAFTAESLRFVRSQPGYGK